MNLLRRCQIYKTPRVHENGDKSFFDEKFNMLENWKLSETQNGPETVQKSNLIESLRNIEEEEKKKKEEESKKGRQKVKSSTLI